MSADLPGTDADDDAPAAAPPVVAVVVAGDRRGGRLAATLAALDAQDYPALSVVVAVDPADERLPARIAAAHPRALVRPRSADATTFAAAADEAARAVEGAPFLCFCHDDVVPDPSAVRLLVEEAYRSNAAIVGPKLVAADHPEVILEVGATIDRYGVPYTGIEPGEVDQEQHDAVRDVLFVSHAFVLVRADLFADLGGFDPATAPGSDDIDLCWRARIAGARVVVAPEARVGHRESSSLETRGVRASVRGDEVVAVTARARMLRKGWSGLALVRTLPVAAALGFAEAVALLATGRLHRARRLAAGWLSVLFRRSDVRAARAAVEALRRVDDGDLSHLMVRGSARLRTYAHRVHAGERLALVGTRTRDRVNDASHRLGRVPGTIAAVLAAVLLFGGRGLITGRVPQVTGFRVWPGVADAWSTLTGAWRTTGLGRAAAADPVFGVMAGLQTLLLGQGGLARSLVIGGALPLGAFGAYRLVRRLAAAPVAGVAAAVAYVAYPVGRNAVWHGAIGPLVCFALAPFLVALLFRGGRTALRSGPGRVRVAAGGALLLAVMGAVWPPAFAFAVLVAVAILLAGPFAGDAGLIRRVVAFAGAATLGAVVLTVAWLTSFPDAVAATFGLLPRTPLGPIDVLTARTGRAGAGLAPYGVVIAALVPLALASGARLAWAMRAWVLAVCSFALAWLPSRLAPDAALPAPEGILIGAALGLAIAAGIGVAAVIDDLHRHHFGWPQLVAGASIAGLTVGGLGLVADTTSGRWGLGPSDWPSTLSWIGEQPPPGGFRVLWLGDPSVLPADPSVIGRTGYALTADGTGDARNLWAAPPTAADGVVGRAVAAAEAGSTVRLGRLLAPAAVRYVVFVRRAAPGRSPVGSPTPALEAALVRQLDLELVQTAEAGSVYRNAGWVPGRAVVRRPPARLADPDSLAAVLGTIDAGARGVDVDAGTTPAIGPGTLLWSASADAGWRARIDDRTLRRDEAPGGTNEFRVDRRAAVTVDFRGGAGRLVPLVVQILAWPLLLAVWFRARRRDRRSA
ncbi:MAG: glycosyltransferase [Actinomycetota bacterium]